MVGWYFYESEKGGTVYKARLHNTVQDIQKLAQCIRVDQICCKNGLSYCDGIPSVLVYPIQKKYSPKFVIGSIKSKKTLTEKSKMVNLSIDGTVASGKDCLLSNRRTSCKNINSLE